MTSPKNFLLQLTFILALLAISSQSRVQATIQILLAREGTSEVETNFNVQGSLLFQQGNDIIDIFIQDLDNGNSGSELTRPSFSISQVYGSNSIVIPDGLELVPGASDDPESPIYRLKFPLDQPGEYRLYITDADAGDLIFIPGLDFPVSADSTTFLTGVFILPDTSPGFHEVARDVRESRIVYVYPEGTETAFNTVTYEGIALAEQDINDPPIDLEVSNTFFQSKRADAFSFRDFGTTPGRDVFLRATDQNGDFEEIITLGLVGVEFNTDFDLGLSDPNFGFNGGFFPPGQPNGELQLSEGISRYPFEYVFSKVVAETDYDILSFGLTAVVREIRNGKVVNSRQVVNSSRLIVGNMNSFAGMIEQDFLTAELFDDLGGGSTTNLLTVYPVLSTDRGTLNLPPATRQFEVRRLAEPDIRITGRFTTSDEYFSRFISFEVDDAFAGSTVEYRVEQPEIPFIGEWTPVNPSQNSFFPIDTFFGENLIRMRVVFPEDSPDFRPTDRVSDAIILNILPSRRNPGIFLDPQLSGSFIPVSEVETEYNLRISGTLNSEYFDQSEFFGKMPVPQPPRDIILRSTQITESGEFLDDQGRIRLSINQLETEYNPELDVVNWSSMVRVETGFNKIQAHYIPSGFDSSNTSPFHGNLPVPFDTAIIEVEGTAPQPEEFVDLTGFSDFWSALVNENVEGGFTQPARIDFTGFQWDPSSGNIVRKADMNGDNIDDFVTVTGFNTVWAFILGEEPQIVPINTGLIHDDSINWTAFVGDLNESGLPDLVQVTDEQIWISRPTAPLEYPDPTFLQFNPLFVNDPESGNYLDLVDMTNDGDLDLVFIDADGIIYVMEYMQSRFDDPRILGSFTRFQWNPEAGQMILFGDYNGDGFKDVAYNNAGRMFVALAKDASGELEPLTQFWGTSGVVDLENWWMFTTNANGSAQDDIIILNNIGETWLMESFVDEQTGQGEFMTPVRTSATGYRHNVNGGGQAFFGNFDPEPDAEP